MARFSEAIPIILKHEGGFVNHPSDPGGATNRGITFKLFKRYAVSLGLNPTVEDLKNLTEEQAEEIYFQEFWQPMKGDEIESQQIANIVFDGFVNMGGRALKLFQKEAGVTPDGKIGPITLSIVNNSNETVLFTGYKDARIDYYKRLVDRKPQLGVFLKGWLNRINSFTLDKSNLL